MSVEIYPKLTTEDLEKYKEVLKNDERKINTSRINEILAKKKEMKDMYDRYHKIKRQWAGGETAFMIGGIIVTGAVAAVVTIFVPVFGAVIGTVGGSIAVEIAAYIGIQQFFNKKKQFYKQRCVIIKCFLDRLYLLFTKISADGIITDAEYESYQKLIKEFESELTSQKSKSDEDMEKFIKDYQSKMQTKIDKMAKEEVKKDVEQQLLSNAVLTLRGKIKI